MPIPVMNFAGLPTQGYPAAQGLLEAIAQGMALRNMPKDIRAENERKRLANALSQVKLQYEPQMNEEDLLQKQLHNQFYPQDIQSQIADRQMQTQMRPEELKLGNRQADIAQQNSQRVGNRFNNPLYNFNRMLNTFPADQRKAVIAENIEPLLNMLAASGNAANDSIGGGQEPEVPQNIEFTPEQIQALQNIGVAKPGESPEMPNVQRLPTKFQVTPQNVETLSKAFQTSANNALTTPATRRQVEGAIQVGDYMNSSEFMDSAKKASEFAGVIGKGKKTLAQLSQSNPEGYENYLSFKHHHMVLVLNRIKTLDGMGATNAQREELNGMYNATMDSLTSNPDQFMIQLNMLKRATDAVAKSVEKSYNVLGYPSRLETSNNNQPAGNQNPASPGGQTYYPETDEWK